MRPLTCLETSIINYQVTRRHKIQSLRNLLRKSKNCQMQDITVFCNYSCSVPTDTLGLYCSVNRQDTKLDRVSVFCYNKRCRLRVKTQ